MKLFYRVSGQGHPLIILHGLLGSSDNWYSLAKTFSQHATVYLVDQRNHGQSPHSEELNYPLLIEDLHSFIKENNIQKPDIIGHSMGGKVAMGFALKYSDLLRKLIVVDIVPKDYPIHHDTILDGLNSIQINELKSRTDADEQLSKYVPEASVRQFLLKNLGRDSNQQLEWKMNLAAIGNNIEKMSEGISNSHPYSKEALFIMGSRSNYFKKGDDKIIHKFFPKANIKLLDAGHWIHAERPVEFGHEIISYLKV